MCKNAYVLVAAGALMGSAAASALADEVVFDRTVHRGDDQVDYTVTVSDTDAPGFFRVTVEVDNTENANIADITAIYLEFAPDDFDAAGWYDPTPGVDFIQQSDAILRHIQFNTNDVGNGNITGNGDLFEQFDIGIAIGESDGMNQGDDFQSVTFDVRVQAGLTLEDLVAVGVRGQSVGEPGSSRTGSSKEFGLLPCTADFNEDGFVDSRDLMIFLNVWNAGAPIADIDQNGVVDTRDIIAFLNLWSQGC